VIKQSIHYEKGDNMATPTNLITLTEVERAWADSVGAADYYERTTLLHDQGGCDWSQVERALENMQDTTRHAQRLQERYNEQYEAQYADKRVVLAFDGKTTKIDPSFCDHKNAIHYIEPDGDYWVCSDCGAWLDEHGDIFRQPQEMEF
jgi:hypothetical protein